MPTQRCEIDGKPGWKWDEGGKCYTYEAGDDESEKQARRKAVNHGIAMGDIEIEGQAKQDAMELASIVNVPVITTGVFQGHKGPQVIVDDAKYQQLLRGSNRFRPLLKQAIMTGEMPGNPDFFKRLGKPMPAPITLNHQVLENDKIKEALKNVEVEFAEDIIKSPEFPDGKPWIVEKFSGVDPLAADIIRRFFTKRSVEILELTDPDTGEILPVIISTAFLDKATPPAVPGQTDNILVEFAGLNESHYVIYSEQGVNIMPDNVKNETVDVAELQTIKATLTAQISELQAKFEKAEADRQKAIELAMKQEQEKDAKIAELQAKQDAADADKLVTELSRIRRHQDRAYQISPAFLDIVKPVIQKGGVVELQDGENQRQAMARMIDQIAELASKGAVLIPLSTQGAMTFESPTNAKKTKAEMISELMEKEGLSENDAWVRVTEQTGEYKVEV